MTGFAPPRGTDIFRSRHLIQTHYEALKSKQLKLNLTRGKPSAAQLALSAELLNLPGEHFASQDGTDCRNYGGLQGLVEARTLFSSMLGAPPEQVVVANNSSLALMHDVIVFALLKGTCDGAAPWSTLEDGIAFLCPVPGYDRHYTICAEYGIRMIPVPLRDDGPDMDEVEQLVAQDASIKGMWCVPKYSNPTGTVYSDTAIERLAAMNTAAPDFRLFWDNAYAVHHLTDERVEIANILDLCAKHEHANRAFVFASTSKITLAGAGLALFASSRENVKWLLARMTPQTIGPDKLNQLRHVHFLKDEAGIASLMDKHRAVIAPKFNRVLAIFEERLAYLPQVTWTRPKGGYFITLEVPGDCARRVVSLAKDAGIELTPAGATYPHGEDQEDRTIRIAPTYPELSEVEQAAEGVAMCVQLACAEKMPKHIERIAPNEAWGERRATKF